MTYLTSLFTWLTEQCLVEIEKIQTLLTASKDRKLQRVMIANVLKVIVHSRIGRKGQNNIHLITTSEGINLKKY